MKRTTQVELVTPHKCSDVVTAIAISIQAIVNATPYSRDDRVIAVRTIAAYFNMTTLVLP